MRNSDYLRPKAILTMFILASLLVGAVGLSQEKEATDPAIGEFRERAEKYMELHKRVQDSIPPVDEASHPELIIPRQKKLAEGIQLVRKGAKQGDVITPVVRPAIVGIIKAELNGPTGKEARAEILGEGNPAAPGAAAKIKPGVNEIYPSAAPRTTVPPFLLLRLPELPKGLEYRFVGKDLVLIDTTANLVVDILPQAIP